MKLFDNLNPMDFRYYGRNKLLFDEVQPYLSENAMINYMGKVEVALVQALAGRGLCSQDVVAEVEKSCSQLKAEEVYAEEDRIRHNIRALVNCIRKRVSDKAKPYVHFTTTSHDIICTAETLRLKEFTEKVLLSKMLDFEKTLINLAKREKDTVQIGRTHGQHAEPLTFGFTIAEYVSRFGARIQKVKESANELRGKISGAVGAYNASSLFFDDAEKFEKEVLALLGLRPATHSTQVTEPEYMADYVHAIISTFGVIANLADDMRQLQRSEIAEVGEVFGKDQVGSSTMPHKRNPINFENVKSMWKAYMPRMITLYSDQISEHQRDLTNSASSRYVPELVAAFTASLDRINKVMSRLVVDKENIKANFDRNADMIIAEPLYILLAAHNHSNAHEHVRKLTLESQKSGRKLQELVFEDKTLKQYLDKFTEKQLNILKNPMLYIGQASKKAERVCKHWGIELEI